MVYMDAGALGADERSGVERSGSRAGFPAAMRRRFYGLVPLVLMGAVIVYVMLANG